MVIVVEATVAIIAISNQSSLDSILANKDCKAQEDFDSTSSRIMPEQTRKIIDVSGYCTGKVLKNMYGDDPKITTPEQILIESDITEYEYMEIRKVMIIQMITNNNDSFKIHLRCS